MFGFAVDVEKDGLVGTVEVIGEVTYDGRPATHLDPPEGPEGEVTDVSLVVWDGETHYDVSISRAYAAELVGPERSRLVQQAINEGTYEVLPRNLGAPIEPTPEWTGPIFDEDIPF